MSWENIINTGAGEIEFRVKVAGLTREFVTNSLMEKDVRIGDRIVLRRRNGLVREGFTISEEAILPENKVELQGNSFKIVDVNQQATLAFHNRASKQAYLLEDIDETGTLVRINTSNWSVGEYLWIGSECMRVTVAPTAWFLGGFFVGVARAQLGTIAVAHPIQNQFGIEILPFVQNVPFGIENRRVWLYAYGKGDNLQGDGTLIWKGVVTEEASFNGMDWSFEAGPLTEILETQFGVDSENIRFRGIDLTGAPNIYPMFQITLTRMTGATFGTSIAADAQIIVENEFFESREALLAAINDRITASPAGSWPEEPRIAIVNNRLAVQFSTPSGGDPRMIQLRARLFRRAPGSQTELDPGKAGGFFSDGTGFAYTPPRRNLTTSTFSDPVTSVVPNANYTIFFREQMPRQFAVCLAGRKRVYLDGAINSIWFADAVSLVDDSDEALQSSIFENYLDASRSLEILIGSGPLYFVNNDHKLLFTRNYQPTLPTFIAGLIQDSKRFASQGILPVLYDDDFDLADIRRVFSSLSLNQAVRYRNFQIGKPGPTIMEFLQAEFRLVGVYPVLTPDGSITIRPLRTITANERKKHYLTADNIITDRSFPVISTNKYGIWNSMNIQPEYNILTEEHSGPKLTVNIVDSIAQNAGKLKSIDVLPFSSRKGLPGGFNETTYLENIVSIADRQCRLVAYKYDVISVEVPMTLFSSSLGDPVSVRSKQLPSTFSTQQNNFRGQSEFSGFITRREFDLDTGFGTLDIFVTAESLPAGSLVVELPAPITVIAPTVVPQTASVSGVFMDVVVDFGGGLLPDLSDYANLFRPGDTVEFREWDSDTPDIGNALISDVSVSGSQVVIQAEFSGSIPSSIANNPADYRLQFDRLDSATFPPSEHQTEFAYVDTGIKTSARIEYPAGNLLRKIRI